MIAIDIKNLQDLLRENANTYFSAELSIKLAELKIEVDKQIKVYNEIVKRLLNECGIKDEEGNLKTDEEGNIELIPEKKNFWIQEINKIEDTEFAIKTNFSLDEIKQLKLNPVQAATILQLKENPKD